MAQRTGFCTMGAVSDACVMGDLTRLRQWGLETATATLGFAALAGAGVVAAPQTLYASTRWLWLLALAGGLAFGFGMVLASGCVSKALVTGVAAFATLKGLTAVLRADTVDRVALELGFNADLGTLIAAWVGLSPGTAVLLAGLSVGGGLLFWALGSAEARVPSMWSPERVREHSFLRCGG
ncbi:MAG: YeeE/YedE family protein, partial [Pseudomonadota bacterium]|nr:YeeE/YedE family protein [Pseudomonadota bacterium]